MVFTHVGLYSHWWTWF